MLRRHKRIANIILIMGVALGSVACSNNNDIPNEELTKTKTKVEKNISEESKENKDEDSKDDTSKSSKENKDKDSKDDTSKPSKPSQDETSKPSTSKPNKPSQGETSKPSTSKPNKPSEPVKPQQRTWQYMSDLSQQTFVALNNYRQANGVSPLKYSSTEQARANQQAEYNARTETGNHDFLQISILSTVDTTAQQFINRWANSAGHRKNMLDDTLVAGAVSVYKDSNGCYYVVASFDDGWGK